MCVTWLLPLELLLSEWVVRVSLTCSDPGGERLKDFPPLFQIVL